MQFEAVWGNARLVLKKIEQADSLDADRQPRVLKALFRDVARFEPISTPPDRADERTASDAVHSRNLGNHRLSPVREDQMEVAVILPLVLDERHPGEPVHLPLGNTDPPLVRQNRRAWKGDEVRNQDILRS